MVMFYFLGIIVENKWVIGIVCIFGMTIHLCEDGMRLDVHIQDHHEGVCVFWSCHLLLEFVFFTLGDVIVYSNFV